MHLFYFFFWMLQIKTPFPHNVPNGDGLVDNTDQRKVLCFIIENFQRKQLLNTLQSREISSLTKLEEIKRQSFLFDKHKCRNGGLYKDFELF